MSTYEALQHLFGEKPAMPACSRRLDVDALKNAARAAGFANEHEAVRHVFPSGVGRVLNGIVPGSLARFAIARALGVSEYHLWPTVAESKAIS
jgi:hypothetical protein